MSLAIILPAAGRSVRFGRNKLLEALDGRPVIVRAIEAFLCRSDVALVVLATPDPGGLGDVLRQHSPGGQMDARIRFSQGGHVRAASVRHALHLVDTSIEWVAVHDAARPLVSQGLIDRTLAAAREHGAAVPALPVTLTIKQATGPLPAPVQRTVPRDTLWAMQTPQIMRRSALDHAFRVCPLQLEAVTDDVQLLELAGQPVWLVEGEERNIKITTATDLAVAEMHLRQGN